MTFNGHVTNRWTQNGFFPAVISLRGKNQKKEKKTGLARSLNLSELFPPSSKAEVNSRVFWRNISREAHPNMFAGVNGLEKLFAENAEGCLRSNGEKNAKPQPHNKLEFDTVFVFSTFTRRLF